MNTQKFAETRGEFDVFDMKAKFDFRSASSISFTLGRWGSIVQFEANGPTFDDRNSFTVCGWIDVHHPCEGTARAHVRIHAPNLALDFESTNAALTTILASLEIPPDESCEVFVNSCEWCAGFWKNAQVF